LWGWEGEGGKSKTLVCHFIKFEQGRNGRVDGVLLRDRKSGFGLMARLDVLGQPSDTLAVSCKKVKKRENRLAMIKEIGFGLREEMGYPRAIVANGIHLRSATTRTQIGDRLQQ
jgi:hypothetical protein